MAGIFDYMQGLRLQGIAFPSDCFAIAYTPESTEYDFGLTDGYKGKYNPPPTNFADSLKEAYRAGWFDAYKWTNAYKPARDLSNIDLSVLFANVSPCILDDDTHNG